MTRSLKRTEYPTASPIEVPSSLGDPLGDGAGGDPTGLGVADHAVDAAARPARQSFGSWVLLPDPVSPATTMTWWSRIASIEFVRVALRSAATRGP